MVVPSLTLALLALDFISLLSLLMRSIYIIKSLKVPLSNFKFFYSSIEIQVNCVNQGPNTMLLPNTSEPLCCSLSLGINCLMEVSPGS